MDGSCPAPSTGGAFLAQILGTIDCQAQAIGSGGYQALASPGSAASIALTALLTIFIALFGIRMLMGQEIGVNEALVAVLRIGAVLVIATSWPAYRIVAYDLVLHGPAEIAQAIGRPAELPGTDGGLVDRLQATDNAVVTLGALGVGRGDPSAPASADGTRLPVPAVPPVSDEFGLGFGRLAFLVGAIGSLGIVRIVGGLLLALAPLFAGLLLFEGTLGIFLGWMRMLVATALAALSVTIVLAVELSILEPWLASVLALREARYETLSAPVELIVVTVAFAIVLFAAIAMSARIAFATRVPAWGEQRSRTVDREQRSEDRRDVRMPLVSNGLSSSPNARATQLADALAVSQQREASATPDAGRALTVSGSRVAAIAGTAGARDVVSMPLGQGYRGSVRRLRAAPPPRGARA